MTRFVVFGFNTSKYVGLGELHMIVLCCSLAMCFWNRQTISLKRSPRNGQAASHNSRYESSKDPSVSNWLEPSGANATVKFSEKNMIFWEIPKSFWKCPGWDGKMVEKQNQTSNIKLKNPKNENKTSPGLADMSTNKQTNKQKKMQVLGWSRKEPVLHVELCGVAMLRIPHFEMRL